MSLSPPTLESIIELPYSNLESLGEENSSKHVKKKKSEKKKKYDGKKICTVAVSNPESGETESNKAVSSLTTVMCNDCQMIASHDPDFLVPHKTCICSLINIQAVCCLVGYEAWVERLPSFAIYFPFPQSFNTYDILSKNIWPNRITPHLLTSHANAMKSKITNPNQNQNTNYTLI